MSKQSLSLELNDKKITILQKKGNLVKMLEIDDINKLDSIDEVFISNILSMGESLIKKHKNV